MTEAQTQQKATRSYQKHGHFKRVRALKRRGFDAVNGRTYAGREAKRWRAWATQQKGNGSMQPHTRHEINLAMFDLWLLLELGEAIARDATERGAVLNKRRKELPRIHDQYNQVSIRFSKRCEALALDKGNGLDLARRLMQERAAREQNGHGKPRSKAE
jgi:hypothetical protein